MASDAASDDGDPSLLRLRRKVRALAEQVSRVEKNIYEILCVIDDELKLRQAVPARYPRRASAAQETERTWARTGEVMAAEAARGATRIKMWPLPDGWVKVIIDGRPVKLPPMRASLFAALIADIGPSDDEFIAWKSAAQMKKMLSKQSGKPVTGHALTNLVSRLRKDLREQANLHRNFIQRNAHRGLRFALKRPGPDSGGETNAAPSGASY